MGVGLAPACGGPSKPYAHGGGSAANIVATLTTNLSANMAMLEIFMLPPLGCGTANFRGGGLKGRDRFRVQRRTNGWGSGYLEVGRGVEAAGPTSRCAVGVRHRRGEYTASWAPQAGQNMPDRLRQEPITALHPASMTPEPTKRC